MNLSKAPAQQVDCFEKARAAQLECLQHVPVGNLGPLGVARKADRHRRVTSASRSGSVGRAHTHSSGDARGTLRPDGGTCRTRWLRLPSRQRRFRRKNPLEMPPPMMGPARSRRNRNLQRFGLKFQRSSRGSSLSPPPPQAGPAARLISRQSRRPKTGWSAKRLHPIDYSPLVTATIRARWSESDKDTPDSLIIRCRQSHVELLLRIAGAARVAPGSDIQVSYQLNDQSFVKRAWTASVDGKSASYPDDAAALLSSIPDGARLTIDLFDSSGAGHDAMFQLTGLDAIRRKIETACKSLSGRVSERH